MIKTKILLWSVLAFLLVAGSSFGQEDKHNLRPELHPEAYVAFQRAAEARRAGQFDAALAAYDEAIRLCPEGAHIYINRGQTRLENGQVDDAIADYTEAIRLKPAFVELAYVSRAEAWLKKGDIEKAIADGNAAVQSDPGSCVAHFARARAYDRQGSRDLADRDYAEAMRLNPQLKLECLLGAYQSVNEGKWDEAIGQCTIFVRLDATNAGVYRARAIAYLGKGDLEEALDDVTMSIQLNPRDAESYLLRAFVCGETNDFASMIADLGKAIELGVGAEEVSTRFFLQRLWDAATAGGTEAPADRLGSDPITHLCVRGALRVELQRLDGAWEDFAEAQRLDPASAWAHIGRAHVAGQRRDDRMALAELTFALSLDPRNAYANYERGASYLIEGDRTKAMADFTSAINCDPKLESAYYARGRLAFKAGDLDAALADMAAVIARNPDHKWAYSSRGAVYHEKGMYDLAIADFSRAVEISPDPAIFAMRARTYLAMGETAKAAEDKARAQESMNKQNTQGDH